jgi:hypothetical protein
MCVGQCLFRVLYGWWHALGHAAIVRRLSEWTAFLSGSAAACGKDVWLVFLRAYVGRSCSWVRSLVSLSGSVPGAVQSFCFKSQVPMRRLLHAAQPGRWEG